jgi:site-specific recombinase XerD
MPATMGGRSNAAQPARIATRSPPTTTALTISPAFRPAASYARADDRAAPHHTLDASTRTISPRPPDTVPALIAAAGDRASLRFLEFFAANIRNPHTRRAYARPVAGFMARCDANRVGSTTAVQPLHVAAWIEKQTRDHAAPKAKLRLAALRHLFDWLVTGQVVPTNPAGSVRGPAHVVKAAKTPVLAPKEARALIDRIEITTPVGLRDRALIGLTVFSFARIGAALGMKVEDVFTQNRRLWVRLREKGGKAHAMPCHHNLETYLNAYIEGAGLAEDPKGPPVSHHRPRHWPVDPHPLPQANAYAMIGRPAAAAGIATKLGNHSFQATGITAYLKNEARWRRRRRWRTTPAPEQRSSTTEGARNSASTRWSGSGCDRRRCRNHRQRACQRPPVACVAALTPVRGVMHRSGA